MKTRQKRTIYYMGRWVLSHWYSKHITVVPEPDRRKTVRVQKREREMEDLRRELDLMVDRGEITRDTQGRYGLVDVRAD